MVTAHHCYPGLQWGKATNKQKDRKIMNFVKEKDEFQFATRCLKALATKEINIIKEKPWNSPLRLRPHLSNSGSSETQIHLRGNNELFWECQGRVPKVAIKVYRGPYSRRSRGQGYSPAGSRTRQHCPLYAGFYGYTKWNTEEFNDHVWRESVWQSCIPFQETWESRICAQMKPKFQ